MPQSPPPGLAHPQRTSGGHSAPGSDPSAMIGGYRVDPAAIPNLRKVFTNALVKLDKQIEMAISDVRIRPWAGDPVSQQAAEEFNLRSFGGGDSVLDSLQAYQRQLKSALDALQQVEQQYHEVERDNTRLINGQSGC
ncbi:MAG: transcriptional regulator [Kutzneria sp.]|nr:transcriptional regulator [Kutzneria sp.]MBV9847389.1 transcriptional regulator [Kutzneria sp.]